VETCYLPMKITFRVIIHKVLLLVVIVSGSIPGGVTGDFFRGSPDETMCSEVESASESKYQGFLLG